MTTLTGEDVWEAGQEAIVGTNPPGGRAHYETVRVARVTPRGAQIVLTTGARFWREDGVEVGGTRVILPPWAPSYPILAAQIAETDRVQGILDRALAFARDPGQRTAQDIAEAVTAYLDTAA